MFLKLCYNLFLKLSSTAPIKIINFMLRLSYRSITEEEHKVYLTPVKYSHPLVYYCIPAFTSFLKPLIIYITAIAVLKIVIENIRSFIIIGTYVLLVYILFILYWKLSAIHTAIVKIKKYYSEYRAKQNTEVQNGKVEIIHLRSNFVWEVKDIEGLGYLYFISPYNFVYIAPYDFLEHKNNIPTNELIIERLPNLKHIIKLIPMGEKIKVKKSVSIKKLPLRIGRMAECEIFKIDNLK